MNGSEVVKSTHLMMVCKCSRIFLKINEQHFSYLEISFLCPSVLQNVTILDFYFKSYSSLLRSLLCGILISYINTVFKRLDPVIHALFLRNLDLKTPPVEEQEHKAYLLVCLLGLRKEAGLDQAKKEEATVRTPGKKQSQRESDWGKPENLGKQTSQKDLHSP